MIGQTVEHTRNLKGDASTHQHVPDAREHGSVQGRQVGNLNLLQKVDPHRVVMTFAGQTYLDEVGNDAQLDQFARIVKGVFRQGFVRLVFHLAAGDVIRFPNAPRHFGERKTIEPAPHMSAGVAFLQPPGQDLIDGRTGNDPKLSKSRYCPREPPT